MLKKVKGIKEIINFFQSIDDNEISDVTPKRISLKKSNAMKQYVKRLNSKIKDRKVKNIAISGGYGSGKTTIAMNYKIRHPLVKSTTITLGTFFESEELSSDIFNKDNNSNSENEQNDMVLGEQKVECTQENETPKSGEDKKLSINERLLVDKIEKSILKQLVYCNKEHKCPDSNISRIRTKNMNDNLLFLSVFYIITCLIYYKFQLPINTFIKYVFSFNEYEKIEDIKKMLLNSNNAIFIILSIVTILFILSFIKIVRTLIKYVHRNAKIIVLKINGSEVKFENESDLTFTKQLKEIIYIFKVNKFEVVFFEDIDRFSNDVALKVIEELKELNKIINQSSRTKVTFVYLFKDKILSNHENKGKFYDYSLSVLPISTKYNSLINLNNRLDSEKNISSSLISNDLKRIASNYIMDYRSIINLVNDYSLFNSIIPTNNQDRLFAIVLFKNYYIQQYDDILKKDNIIEEKFKSINNKKQEIISNKKAEIDKINKHIEELTIYSTIKIKELKKMLVYSNSDSLYNNKATAIKINGKRYSIDEFLSEDFDLDLIKNYDSLELINEYSSNKIKFDDFDNKEKFIERLEYKQITNLENKKIEELQKEIEKIEKMNIAETFRTYNVDNKKIDLLDELIEYEYIAEDYVDYITSPPLEDNVTNVDVNFIFTVTHSEYSYDKELTNINYVTKHLQRNFNSPYILNYTLINNLIDSNSPYLDKICNQFNEMTKEKANFLKSYKEKYQPKYFQFCELLHQRNIILWNNYREANLEDKSLDYLFMYDLLSIEHIEEKNIKDIDCLRKMVRTYYSDKEYIEYESIIRNNIKKLQIRFNSLNRFNEDFIKFIYDNNLYKFSEENISYLNKIEILDSPFSKFKDLKDKKIIDNIFNNLDYFFQEYYMPQEKFIFGDSNIIKKEVLKRLTKNEYIEEVYKREEFTIAVKDIPKDLINLALKYNHINPTWGNISKTHNKDTWQNVCQFIITNKRKLFYNQNNLKKINGIKSDIIRQLLVIGVNKEDYDIIDIIANNYKNKKDLRQYLTDIHEKEYVELLIKNDLLEFKKEYIKKLLKLNVTNLPTYLDNWYKNDHLNLYNSIKDNDKLIDIILSSEVISDDYKLFNIINYRKDKLACMKKAFGDSMPHTIHIKSIPKVFNKLEDRINIIETTKETITFAMK